MALTWAVLKAERKVCPWVVETVESKVARKAATKECSLVVVTAA